MSRILVGCVFPSAAMPIGACALAEAKLSAAGVDLKFYRSHPEGSGLAGSDADRLDELKSAIEDPQTDSIIIGRGGYGASRILPILRINVKTMPKRIFGYSDATCILNEPSLSKSIRMFHSPMLIDIAKGLAEADFIKLVSGLRGCLDSHFLFPLSSGSSSISGSTTGKLVGGNITVLLDRIGTPSEPEFDGTILLLEDVGEVVYRFDRALARLCDCGILRRVEAVLFGEIDSFTEGNIHLGKSPSEVALSWMGGLGKPMATGLPFGHGLGKQTIELGRSYALRVEGSEAILSHKE